MRRAGLRVGLHQSLELVADQLVVHQQAHEGESLVSHLAPLDAVCHGNRRRIDAEGPNRWMLAASEMEEGFERICGGLVQRHGEPFRARQY